MPRVNGRPHPPLANEELPELRVQDIVNDVWWQSTKMALPPPDRLMSPMNRVRLNRTFGASAFTSASKVTGPLCSTFA